MTAPCRIENPGPMELTSAAARLAAGEHFVLQFSHAAYPPEVLRVIDTLCAAHGDRVQVRFYGHHQGPFDAGVLRELPSVTNLSIDGVDSVQHLEQLVSLERLRRLTLRINDLEDTRLLRHPNLRNLVSLGIGPTTSGRVDLTCLENFDALESLFISRQTQGIETMARLGSLRTLALWCIPQRTGLGFLSGLRHLEQLTLGLGGRSSIDDVEAPGLKSLEIARVRGLMALPDLGRFPELTALSVEDQAQVTGIDFTRASDKLQQLRVLNCKQLRHLPGLDRLAGLEVLRIGVTALQADEFEVLPLPPALKVCSLFTGKRRPDRQLRASLDARGYAEF